VVVSRGLRRSASIFLASFFLAVVAAPHRHLNPIADLISNERSDSGVFIQILGDPVADGQTHWGAAALIDDDPCLACFMHDCVAKAACFFGFIPSFTFLQLPQRSTFVGIPGPRPRALTSRAPPGIS
jgi:hypothetical protein